MNGNDTLLAKNKLELTAIRSIIKYLKNTTDTDRTPVPVKYLSLITDNNINNKITDLNEIKNKLISDLVNITKEHLDALRSLYGGRISNKEDTRYPFYVSNEATKQRSNKKLNVIFIVLESFRDYEVGEHDGLSLTPNFDRISKGNFTPKYFSSSTIPLKTISKFREVVVWLLTFIFGDAIFILCSYSCPRNAESPIHGPILLKFNLPSKFFFKIMNNPG